MMLAVGLALLPGFASLNARAQSLPFDSANHVASIAPAIQDIHESKIAFFMAANPSANDAKRSAGSVRPRAWSMGVLRSDVFRDDDHAMVSVYLPMKGAATTQRISERLFQSEEPGSLVSNIRALSLIAQKRINAEFAYSAQVSKSSYWNATARYRLTADPRTGKSDVVIGVAYKAVF